MPVKLANLTPYSNKNTHIKALYIWKHTHLILSTQAFIPGGVKVPSWVSLQDSKRHNILIRGEDEELQEKESVL